MSQATLRVQKISGHAGSVAGEDTQREYTVCKLIDTTTCIGCKACEVACMEWNDLPFGETVFDNTYQTMPETRWNYWNLILFNEHEREDDQVPIIPARLRHGLVGIVENRFAERKIVPFHAGDFAGLAADAGGGVNEFADGVFALRVFAGDAAGMPGNLLNA